MINFKKKIFLSINSESTSNPSLLWETAKAYIRGLAISYLTTKRRKQSEKQKHLESELNIATSSYLNDPSPVSLEKISALRASLNSLLTHQSHSNVLYSKQKLYEWGNKPSKYLAHWTKSKSDSQFITSIVDPKGVRSFDSSIINNTFKQFYSVLYQSYYSSQKHDSMVSFFDCLTLPVISDEQRTSKRTHLERGSYNRTVRSRSTTFNMFYSLYNWYF